MIKIHDLIRSRSSVICYTPTSNQIIDFNHGTGHFSFLEELPLSWLLTMTKNQDLGELHANLFEASINCSSPLSE